ncbi:hypothetical protein A6770_30740 [Nostoc minutum NIES-26]|uniref:Uncharacterized protein n=1 Tax=Nostoc minutum NIES-26 TaxID=1844469 RepID=A0A367QDA3_9NOSO|nr:hypothetical protein A6770_30740 [Nostoc minutum NIES-26]
MGVCLEKGVGRGARPCVGQVPLKQLPLAQQSASPRPRVATAVRQSGEALAVFSQRGDAGAKAVSVDSKVLNPKGLGGSPKEELPLA